MAGARLTATATGIAFITIPITTVLLGITDHQVQGTPVAPIHPVVQVVRVALAVRVGRPVAAAEELIGNLQLALLSRRVERVAVVECGLNYRSAQRERISSLHGRTIRASLEARRALH